MHRRFITGNTLPRSRRQYPGWYKCADGCGARVDRPDTVCFNCTMAELYGEKDERDDEPEPAA